MMTLFDQERAIEIYGRNVAREARVEGRAEGKAEGIAEGIAEGMEKGIRAMVSTLQKIALAPAAVAQTLVEQFGLTQEDAEQKVQQYWS